MTIKGLCKATGLARNTVRALVRDEGRRDTRHPRSAYLLKFATLEEQAAELNQWYANELWARLRTFAPEQEIAGWDLFETYILGLMVNEALDIRNHALYAMHHLRLQRRRRTLT